MGFSVLLSVYKKEAPDFLNQALASIYGDQTLKPSQIVLVQDGALTPELDYVVTVYWSSIIGHFHLRIFIFNWAHIIVSRMQPF